jgi:hypothetical protein
MNINEVKNKAATILAVCVASPVSPVILTSVVAVTAIIYLFDVDFNFKIAPKKGVQEFFQKKEKLTLTSKQIPKEGNN